MNELQTQSKSESGQALPSAYRFRDIAGSTDPEAFVPVEREEDEGPESSFGELLSAAKDAEWVFRDGESFERLLKSYDDEQTKVSEDHWKKLDDSYDEDQLRAFRELLLDEASEEEWNDTLSEFAETNAARRTVEEHGLTGLGASFGAAALDPTFWSAAGASVVAGDKISGLLLAGQRAGRLGGITAAAARLGFTGKNKRSKVMKVFAEAAAADGAVMALRSGTTSDYSDTDMIIDTIATVAAVGAFEGVSSFRMAKEARKLRQAEDVRKLREAGFTEAEIADEMRSAGAAEAKGDAGPLRFDDYAAFVNSGNHTARTFAEDALQDGVKGGRSSAAVTAARERGYHMGQMNKTFLELKREMKEQFPEYRTLGPQADAKFEHHLSEKVWEAVVLDIDHGPVISKAAQRFRTLYGEIGDKAKRSGMNGFGEFVPGENQNYMRQQWDTASWSKLAHGPDALDEEDFVELMHRGLNVEDVDLGDELDQLKMQMDELKASQQTSRADDVDAPDAAVQGLKAEVEELEQLIEARRFLAMGFVRRMLNRSDGETRPFEELMEDPDSLVKWLRELPEYELKSEEEIAALVKKAISTRSKSGARNVVDRGKKRMKINPAANIEKNGKSVRVADLLSRDAFSLTQNYVHEMTGNIALADRMGIKGPKEWHELKQKAYQDEMRLNAGDPDGASEAAKITDRMEEMKREIYGYNRFDLSSTGNRVFSSLMKYNFMTTMGKAALSATSEMGRILGENRVRNVLKVLPMLHKIVGDSFRTVSKNDSIVKEVNQFNASIGDEHLINYFNSFDETGVMEGRFTKGALNKTELYAHRGSRFMAKASLLAPMDKMLRLISFQSSMNSLYSHLMKGQKARLAFQEMGMDKGLLVRIKQNMDVHGVDTDALGNVTKLNIEKWDRKTADEMMDALTVNGARQVQKTFAGENTRITSHPVGRVFLQFRKFAIDSYVKHLRADVKAIQRGDAYRVMLSNMYAAIMAAIGYSSRTYVSTAGMDEDDRKTYLEERMAPDRLAANIAAYTPSTGVPVTLWNASAGWMFPDALGDGGLTIPVSRASGLSNAGLAQNPTAASLDRFGSFFKDIGNSDPANAVKSGRYALPFQNTIWGDMVLNSAARAIK